MRRQTGLPLRVRPRRNAGRPRYYSTGADDLSRVGFQVQGAARRARTLAAVPGRLGDVAALSGSSPQAKPSGRGTAKAQVAGVGPRDNKEKCDTDAAQ